MSGWWAGRIRQFRRYITASVSASERAALRGWLTPRQLDLFESMHRADQRHGLDVIASLEAAGYTDPDLRLAGLFHDAAKGPGVGVGPRVAWSLAGRYGSWVIVVTRWLPGFAMAFGRLRDHAEQSAELALAAGCPAATAELIRHQAAPRDRLAGEALLLADEAN